MSINTMGRGTGASERGCEATGSMGGDPTKLRLELENKTEL